MIDFDLKCIYYGGGDFFYTKRVDMREAEDWTLFTSDYIDTFDIYKGVRVLHEFNPESDIFSYFKQKKFKEARLFLGDGDTPENFYINNPASEDLVELNANAADFERKSREKFGDSKKPLVIVQMHYEKRKRHKNYSSKYSTY